jgi:protein-S-isoprenylcysteine O-methyltransferase Ste14
MFEASITLLVLLIYYIMDVLLMRKYDRLRAHGSSRSVPYTLAAVAMGSMIVAQPIVFRQLSLRLPMPWEAIVKALGIVLLVLGCALHYWARTNLGQYFGERVEYQLGQTLVARGPYRWVRHPIYTSFFLLAFGVFFVNVSPITAVAVVYALFDFGMVTRAEESLLAEKIPGYADYMKRVPRFFPSLRTLFRKGG